MSVRKSDDFISDVERQWYLKKAGSRIADSYLEAVEATCRLIGKHPGIGPRLRLKEPRLEGWRSFQVFRPFMKQILFYEIRGEDVLMRRTMYAGRDLPRRLVEPPGV